MEAETGKKKKKKIPEHILSNHRFHVPLCMCACIELFLVGQAWALFHTSWRIFELQDYPIAFMD